MTRPDPAMPALIHDLRSAALVSSPWRGLMGRAADALSRLPASMIPRPPAADPDTAALIAKADKLARYLATRGGMHGVAETIHEVADELTRLSALSRAAHEATQALVAQHAETERRCAQIRHLQDGLRDALAENRRKDETIARLRDALGKHGRHSGSCNLRRNTYPFSAAARAEYDAKGCTCGLDAALAKDGTP